MSIWAFEDSTHVGLRLQDASSAGVLRQGTINHPDPPVSLRKEPTDNTDTRAFFRCPPLPNGVKVNVCELATTQEGTEYVLVKVRALRPPYLARAFARHQRRIPSQPAPPHRSRHLTAPWFPTQEIGGPSSGWVKQKYVEHLDGEA
jgi:hypothetical protein